MEILEYLVSDNEPFPSHYLFTLEGHFTWYPHKDKIVARIIFHLTYHLILNTFKNALLIAISQVRFVGMDIHDATESKFRVNMSLAILYSSKSFF